MKKIIAKKNRILLLVLILVGIGTVTGVVHKRLLKQPVYYRYLMEHYLPTVADSIQETCITELIYITNFNDKKEVVTVTFDNYPGLKVEVLDQTSERYGIYKVMTVSLYWEWDQKKDAVLPSVAKIDTIHVNYSDTSSQIVDIGQISIYSGESSEHLLEAVDCTPLYESERVQTYETRQELEIKGFSDSTKETLKKADLIESLSLTCEVMDITNRLEPTRASSGSQVEFKMNIKGSKENRLLELESHYDYYEIEPQILLSDKGGNEHFTTVFNPPLVLCFSNRKEIKEYLQRRAV
ncbi:MAG: hypothetical protein Q4G58_12920 [bacterium]|nr:hypothetical protein [bacterium]